MSFLNRSNERVYGILNCIDEPTKKLNACKQAAAAGDLGILILFGENDFVSCNSVWYAACKNGQVNVIDWLWQQQLPENEIFNYMGCCAKAAKNGHLEVLDWFESKGFMVLESISDIADQYGHSHIVQWMTSGERLCKVLTSWK